MSRTKRRYNIETGEFGGKKISNGCYLGHDSKIKCFWKRILNKKFRKDQKVFAEEIQNNEDEPVPVIKDRVDERVY